MARKSVKIQNKNETATTKRSLIDELELLRSAPSSEASTAEKPLIDTPQINSSNNQELYSLRKEVKKLRSTNILLESDLKNIEQKALDAISEAGKFRELLDRARDNNSTNETNYYVEERQALVSELHHSRNTHAMLTQAVIESENEITRLTKTIEKLSMKLLSA